MSGNTEHRKLAAIMFTDMVGYSALAQRDEALALELLEEHRCVVRDILPRHGGREVKTTGDGFLLEFPSALAAVQCAIDVQAALHARNLAQPEERQVRIRIGIHVGDVVVREGDVHGDGVNLAARIEPLAGPGGIVVSRAVQEQVGNKLEAPLALLGRAELKNIEGRLEIFRVVLPWQRGAPTRVMSSRARRWPQAVPWAVAVVCLAGLVFLLFQRESPSRSLGHPSAASPVRKFELTLSNSISPVISPDGRKLAYANSKGLWLHWLDRIAPPTLLASGESIFDPFWSPQSTDVGYFAGRKLFRVAISGGNPSLVGTVPEEELGAGAAGGAWLGDRIVFATGGSDLLEVPAQGGKVTIALPRREGESDYHNASALPGGRGVLFVIHRTVGTADRIAVWTPGGPRKVLLDLPGRPLWRPVFAPPHHVLFARGDESRGIWAFPISLETLERTGEPIRVSDVGDDPSAAEDGTIAYSLNIWAMFSRRQLTWVDRSGKILNRVGPVLPGLANPSVSPDERRVVATAGESPPELEIWLVELAGAGALQLTRNQQLDTFPGWWKDGRTVVFTTLNEANHQTLRVSVDGTTPDERLFEGTGVISKSGNFLFVNQAPPGSKPVRGYVALTNLQRRFVPFPEPFQRLRALQLSPDDRLLAYDSAEIGRNEVYLVDFPGFTNKTILSHGGGHHPQWNPNGQELFYLTGDGRKLVSRKLNAEGTPEQETKVFDLPESIEGGLAFWPNTYTVAQDGNRFLMLERVRDEAAPERLAKSNVRVVMNWFEEFREKK